MSEGLKHDVVLKVGFLNQWKETDQAKLKAYCDSFDIVLINDETMNFAIDLLQQVLSKK
jgi:hypothetical protein